MNASTNKYYNEIYGDIKSFFSLSFKGNNNLFFGVTTGCLNFVLKSLYSGVNNFKECSLLNDEYFSDCYGFTKEELNTILNDFKISDECKNDIKIFYDGYSCISKYKIVKDLYNPFSIMNSIQTNKNKKKKKIIH